MTEKLALGVTRIMHSRSGTAGTDEVIVVALDDRGAEVTWPRALGFADAFDLNSKLPLPDPLVARDGQGWVTLQEGRSAGASASTLAHSEQCIRYRFAIAAGSNDVDYSKINGLRTEVEGLARWTRMTSVETRLHFKDGEGVTGLELLAKNQPDHVLGGAFDLRLTTSYSHQPQPKNGVFTITDRLTVETRTRSRRSWNDHSAQHRMIQDLMSLAYAFPCAAVMRSAMRHDDQPMDIRKDKRRWWPDAFEPTFGRGDGLHDSLDDREPLFYLDETDPARVSAWLTGFQKWSRPTWIAVTTLFQRNSTVESQLLQIGVALEALGYAIWRQAHPTSKKAPSYPDLLKVVTDAVGIASAATYGKAKRADLWRDRFNRAFKGAKHADNAAVTSNEAIERARQGFVLIRCWLALELGVSKTLLRKRLDEVRTGARR
ncbi:ApeA N-terminal domain 1-containing protein [Herbiconiux daphne]|uniref:ApeA N-terminal domain-containing protein n=1 Tax=Herbiconiux daphne TaxID=2970914 RepID=A0ABT2H4S6_9MICO|nr:hypothetical protein [Herbiconiux daphne]MCS5734947.1 hypothetical protein [Herbiconiux daphne]